MTSKTVWLALVASTAIFLLGVRAFLDPVSASAATRTFGTGLIKPCVLKPKVLKCG